MSYFRDLCLFPLLLTGKFMREWKIKSKYLTVFLLQVKPCMQPALRKSPGRQLALKLPAWWGHAGGGIKHRTNSLSSAHAGGQRGGGKEGLWRSQRRSHPGGLSWGRSLRERRYLPRLLMNVWTFRRRSLAGVGVCGCGGGKKPYCPRRRQPELGKTRGAWAQETKTYTRSLDREKVISQLLMFVWRPGSVPVFLNRADRTAGVGVNFSLYTCPNQREELSSPDQSLKFLFQRLPMSCCFVDKPVSVLKCPNCNIYQSHIALREMASNFSRNFQLTFHVLTSRIKMWSDCLIF